MDGQPAIAAWEDPPPVETIPSWDDVPGDAGRHPDDLQLDPVESQEALEQLVALGYIEAPGPNREQAIAHTVRELRYNLARAYMDDSRHGSAAEILEELYGKWPNEHRFGVQLALCYQALDRIADLRSVVEDLSTRRKADAELARDELRALVQTIRERRRESGDGSPDAGAKDSTTTDPTPDKPEARLQTPDAKTSLSDEERQRYRDLRSRAHYNPHAIDYLWGYVALAEGDYERALDYLLRSEEIDAARPGLHLQIGEAYLKLRRAQDAERSFQKATAIDPENPHAHLGLCRVYLLRRQNRRAAEAALRTIGLLYQFPMAHFCLGVALHRMGRVLPAVEALHTAVAINPNFAEAHQRLAKIYRNRLGDHAAADEHDELAREMRQARRQALAAKRRYRPAESIADEFAVSESDVDANPTVPPAEFESGAMIPAEPDKFITVVSGLPRSGTSLVMQILAAGGMEVLSDGERAADANNPRGYLEYERVKNLRADNRWLGEVQGKVVKIIAQLLPYLPRQYRYKVLYIDRDLDEVLASQRAMLARDGQSGARISDLQLKRVFATQTNRIRKWLANQPNVEVLTLQHRELVTNPAEPVAKINNFFDQALDVAKMTATVDPVLYRQRR
jgi:tetratricopeptide (TPR) repeat protein